MTAAHASVISEMARIYAAAAASDDGERCMVAPAPDLHERIVSELRAGRERLSVPMGRLRAGLPPANTPGFNDGLIIPGTHFRLGTPPSVVRRAASERAPLRGKVRVIVVLVDFDDHALGEDPAHFEELFFSDGELETGSVRDYFHEVSHGLIDLEGDVVGPYRLPETLETYANGEAGVGNVQPNARTMARHAAEAADPDVDFGPYDNDEDGFVDAFIVVHAGPGAEVTGDDGHIWSHKWVLPGELSADDVGIFAYLTIPEDARIGVCAHELGHLIFGWPDLYDTDDSSNGIGNWCLMASGSWNGDGHTPAHPSAWCKANQGWVTLTNHGSDGEATIEDVKDSQVVHRLWRNGERSDEYFLVENRQRDRFDEHLPGDGLLIWHVDDSVSDNTDERHFMVALEQADGRLDLENLVNRGDGGDSYPGSSDNRRFDGVATPDSNSYAGSPTFVAVSEISDSGPSMTARFAVTGSAAPPWPGRFLRQPPPMRGRDVRRWQEQMVVRGHELVVDGIYGSGSEEACRRLQGEVGLTVDGVVGPMTWRATWGAPVEPAAAGGRRRRNQHPQP